MRFLRILMEGDPVTTLPALFLLRCFVSEQYTTGTTSFFTSMWATGLVLSTFRSYIRSPLLWDGIEAAGVLR